MKKNKISKEWINRQRRDIYVRKSKQEDFRSRAVYKLQEINDKHKILKNNLSVIDLGAAPGSWSQYIIRKFKYVLNIDSTLGIENFSSGGRTGFIFVRPYKSIIKSRAFGYLEKLGRKGPFWTSFNNTKEINRIFNFVIKTKDKKWKQVNKFYLDKVMPNNKNNKTFISIVKNEIGLKLNK